MWFWRRVAAYQEVETSGVSFTIILGLWALPNLLLTRPGSHLALLFCIARFDPISFPIS